MPQVDDFTWGKSGLEVGQKRMGEAVCGLNFTNRAGGFLGGLPLRCLKVRAKTLTNAGWLNTRASHPKVYGLELLGSPSPPPFRLKMLARAAQRASEQGPPEKMGLWIQGIYTLNRY